MALKQYTKQLLEESSGQRLTARELAKGVVSRFPAYAEKKRKNSSKVRTSEDLLAQVSAEIGASVRRWKEEDARLRTTSGRPRLYYWSTSAEEIEGAVMALENEGQANTVTEENPSEEKRLYYQTEKHLYVTLARYCDSRGMKSKRIDERKTTSRGYRGGNKWLHPDVVGAQDLGAKWDESIKETAREAFAQRLRLWSFEVKDVVGSNNVRESAFQSISNSSWANVSFLAASEFSEEALAELEILAPLYGLGALRLDRGDPSESEVLIQPTIRLHVEWSVCNRLYQANPDFKEVMQAVKSFLRGGSLDAKCWDIVQLKEDDDH